VPPAPARLPCQRHAAACSLPTLTEEQLQELEQQQQQPTHGTPEMEAFLGAARAAREAAAAAADTGASSYSHPSSSGQTPPPPLRQQQVDDQQLPPEWRMDGEGGPGVEDEDGWYADDTEEQVGVPAA
jgi:hypothetical protein